MLKLVLPEEGYWPSFRDGLQEFKNNPTSMPSENTMITDRKAKTLAEKLKSSFRCDI